ncbi:MAG: hypothetical protein PQJ58_21875 [Spirochaetales bacterium]|nr:hypothetical protein [Spirochaetales bacterium]
MLKSEKIKSAGNRDSVILAHDRFRVILDAQKGMVPDLSCRISDGWINAHWQPWFRSNSGLPWNEKEHSSFWKVPLLFDIAGNFPCIPNFGSGVEMGNYNIPPHGYTAYGTWEQQSPESLSDASGIYCVSSLSEGEHPFRYKKKDLVLHVQNVHYTSLDVTNTGLREEPYNCAWHNTVGPPFLESGCLIDNNADQFKVACEGGEFDSTGRLLPGAETDTLSKVPLRRGGTADLRLVPGVIGYSDFITAAVSDHSETGWSSIVNPRMKLLYLSFFTGPAAMDKDDIPLNFNNLWMNYGGRSYTPWAVRDGLADQTFCLGAENSTGYFANGLKESLENPVLLGKPTYLMLSPGEQRTLHYGTLFQAYPDNILDKGVSSIEPVKGGFIVKGSDGRYVAIKAEWNFESLKSIR